MIALALAACAPGAPPARPGATAVGSPTSPPPQVLGGIEVTGALDDATWSPEDAAWYRVHDEVVVSAGARLTILPGTEVRFTEGASLEVLGVLRAEGEPSAPIRFVSDPEAPLVPDFHPSLPEGAPHWLGVQFVDSPSPDNLLSWVEIDHAQSEAGAVGVVRSAAVLEHLTITGTRLRAVFSDTASVVVRDSSFPSMFGPDDSAVELGLDNLAEYVKGVGDIPEGGQYLIERNVFGVLQGHNDVIDVNGDTWPGPVLQVRDNVFLGGGDEAIDGGGDVLVDGNVFQGFVKDADNLSDGDSNGLSTGDLRPTLAVLTRNVFVGMDHVANFKRGSFGYLEHNTVIGISPDRSSAPGDEPARVLPSSAIRLLIPDPVDPVGARPRDPAGTGAQLDGNVFVDVPGDLFGNPDENGSHGPFVSRLAVSRTLVPRPEVFANADGIEGRAFEYLVGVPDFVDPEGGDYTLARGSPGAGAGFAGLDLGAGVPRGAAVCCATGPVGPDVSVEVGGAGIFSFRWRLDGGAWSDPVEITDPRGSLASVPALRTAPLELSGLAVGPHLLEVVGIDLAGLAQPVTSVTLDVE